MYEPRIELQCNMVESDKNCSFFCLVLSHFDGLNQTFSRHFAVCSTFYSKFSDFPSKVKLKLKFIGGWVLG